MRGLTPLGPSKLGEPWRHGSRAPAQCTYADDTQAYTARPDNLLSCVVDFHACRSAMHVCMCRRRRCVHAWTLVNRLQLNTGKTDLHACMFWCATARVVISSLRHLLDRVRLRQPVDVSPRSRNLLRDTDLTMRCHVQKTAACMPRRSTPAEQHPTFSSGIRVPDARCRPRFVAAADYTAMAYHARYISTCIYIQPPIYNRYSTLSHDPSPACDARTTSPHITDTIALQFPLVESARACAYQR